MCNQSRQARREERLLRREEKHLRRQEKRRLKAEKHAIRQELRNLRRNSDPAAFHLHSNVTSPSAQTFNYYYHYCSQMPGVQQTTQLRPVDPAQVEEMVATLRTMFPD
ncbi:118_t:CDS:1, partial [Acaulospora morrowiae]